MNLDAARKTLAKLWPDRSVPFRSLPADTRAIVAEANQVVHEHEQAAASAATHKAREDARAAEWRAKQEAAAKATADAEAKRQAAKASPVVHPPKPTAGRRKPKTSRAADKAEGK